MTIMTQLRTLFPRILPVRRRSSSRIAEWLRGGDEPGPALLTNPFAQSAWVYACVSAIAQQVAHTPLRFSLFDVKRRGDSFRAEQIMEQGALVELFERPHPQLDRFLFWELIVSWLLLRGKTFVVGLDAHGNVLPINPATILPTHLMVLNPDRLTKLSGPHQLLGYRYQAGHGDLLATQDLLPEEVISLRLANPFDYWGGQSPAHVAELAAQTDYAAAQFMKGLILNNADTGLIVSTRHAVSTEEKEQVLAMLRERKRKAGTADRPLFLDGGAKIEKPAISVADVHFLENRKFSRQEICAIYKTPQEILGFTEDSNRAVAESARLNWIENTIAPLCERLAAAFTPLLRAGRPAPDQTWMWFDLDSLPIMQKARQARFHAAREGFEMGVPVSVLNQLFELGLPALPHGESSYLPSGFQQVGEMERIGARLCAEHQPRPFKPSDAPTRLLGVLGRAVQAQPPIGPAVPKLFHHGEIVWSSATSDSRALESKLSRFFFEQRSRVLARLAAGNATLLESPAEDEALAAFLRPFVRAYMNDLVTDVNATTLRQLDDALAEARGENSEQLTARVRRVFQDAAKHRAPMLARLIRNHFQTR